MRDGFAISMALLAAVVAAWLGIAGPIFSEGATAGFWATVEKWQTLVGAILAIGAAYIAAKPVWSQLAEMRLQTTHIKLEHLRTRSIELEREVTFLYEVTSSVELMIETLLAARATSFYPALPPHVESVERAWDAQQYMDGAIHRFVAGTGPTWGSSEVQKARAAMRDESQRFSVATNKLLLPKPAAACVTLQKLEQTAVTAVPHKNNLFAAADLVHRAIVAERAKIGNRISELEKTLKI